jgi:hypothetical protein
LQKKIVPQENGNEYQDTVPSFDYTLTLLSPENHLFSLFC